MLTACDQIILILFTCLSNMGYIRNWISPHCHHFIEPRNGQVGLLQQNLYSWSAICQQQNSAMLLNSFPMLWKTIAPSAPYFITYSNKTPHVAFDCSSSKSTGLEHNGKQRSNLVRITCIWERPLQLVTLSNSAKSYVSESSDQFHNTNTKKTISWKHSLNILIYDTQKVAKC